MDVIPSSVALTATVGSGATSTSCTLTSTTQSAPGGAFTQFSAITASGTLSSVTDISSGSDRVFNDAVGNYSGGTYTDSLSGCGFTALPKVNFQYQVFSERILRSDGVVFTGTGVYPINPPCNVGGGDTTTSSDSGMGLKLACRGSLEILPGMVAFGTDNTAALRSMIGSASASGSMNAGAAVGQPVCLYFPTGNYLTQPINQPSTLTSATGYGCFFGDEHNHSNLFVIPNITGDVIAWTNSNNNSSLLPLGSTQLFAQAFSGSGIGNQGGAVFRQMTIIGDRLSTAEQNGLAFYGTTQWAFIDDVIVNSMRGAGLIAGAGTSGLNSFNESIVRAARFEQDGDDTPTPASTGPVPAVEITASGSGEDGSNSLSLDEIRIYQPFGPGMRIHNSVSSPPGTSARDIRISSLEVEGSGLTGTDQGGPLLQLGDPGLSSNNIQNVLATNTELLNPVQGYPALLITGGSATSVAGIDVEGLIQGAPVTPGAGAQVVACSQCSLQFVLNSSADYNLEIGIPQPGGGCSGSFIASPGVTYDGEGAEGTLTSCIDPAALTLLHFPARRTYYSTTANPSAIPFPADVTEPIPPGAVATVANAPGNLTYSVSGKTLRVSYLAPLWVVYRTGATAAFNDTWDGATHIITNLNALSGSVVAVGQMFRAEVCNQTTNSGTLAPGANETGTPVVISPGTCANFVLTITNTATPGLSILGE